MNSLVKVNLEDIPRKPKAMPKPKAQPIQQEEEIEEVIQVQKTKINATC